MSNNVKVGILTLLGLVVLILVLTWKTVSVVEVQGYTLIGDFKNISGLLETAEVQYRGFKVGKVVKIEPQPYRILVHMKIDKKLKVPRDSQFVIAFDGLIGQKYIAIVPGTFTGEFCKEGDILPGKSTAGIVDFVDQGTAALEEAKLLLASIRKISDDQTIRHMIVDTLDNFNQLSKDLGGIGPKLESVTIGLDELITGVKPIFADGQVNERLRVLLQNLEEASTDLKDMTKSVRKITDDPETEKDIRRLIKNLKDISEELKGAFSDDETSSNWDDSLRSAAKMAKTFSNFRAGVDADILSSSRFKRGTLRAGGTIAFDPKQYYGIRAGEIADGQGAVLDIYQGNKVSKELSWRWGIIQAGLGIGAEYTLWDRLTLLGDVYGPGVTKTTFGTRWKLDRRWALVTMIERMGEYSDNYYFGVNVRP
ncbi:MAG: MCE family protein [Candidatus Margulisbacteria bacterium]|nr:MCE family protein [Candidatus Margulisiibacteriota bacterium]